MFNVYYVKKLVYSQHKENSVFFFDDSNVQRLNKRHYTTYGFCSLYISSPFITTSCRFTKGGEKRYGERREVSSCK